MPGEAEADLRPESIIRLSVGGEVFQTRLSTLMKVKIERLVTRRMSERMRDLVDGRELG